MQIKKLLYALTTCAVILSGCSNGTQNEEETKVKKEVIDVSAENPFFNACEQGERAENIDIAFVFDNSKSMNDWDEKNNRIKYAEWIVDQLKDNDRATVISFDGEAKLLTETFTNDKEEVVDALKNISIGNDGTSLSAGLEMGINEFAKNPSENRKVMIVVTDGVQLDEGSVKGAFSQSQDASNQGIKIHTIGLGIKTQVEKDVLAQIAGNTEGSLKSIETNADFELLYADLVTSINCLPEANEWPVAVNDEYIIDPAMRNLLKDNGLVKSGIKQTDTYELAKEKSVEPLETEEIYNGGLCSFYNSFTICTNAYTEQGQENEITAVELYPNITVGDLDNLEVAVLLNFVDQSEGPALGNYSAYYEYKEHQSYLMWTDGNETDSLIKYMIIKSL